jgi:hypothetical protein
MGIEVRKDEEPGLTEYRPRFAPHVVGTYGSRFDEAGEPQEQRIRMECTHRSCGEVQFRTCLSGQPRDHVTRFAILHLHRDPFDTPATRRKVAAVNSMLGIGDEAESRASSSRMIRALAGRK